MMQYLFLLTRRPPFTISFEQVYLVHIFSQEVSPYFISTCSQLLPCASQNVPTNFKFPIPCFNLFLQRLIKRLRHHARADSAVFPLPDREQHRDALASLSWTCSRTFFVQQTPSVISSWKVFLPCNPHVDQDKTLKVLQAKSLACHCSSLLFNTFSNMFLCWFYSPVCRFSVSSAAVVGSILLAYFVQFL